MSVVENQDQVVDQEGTGEGTGEQTVELSPVEAAAAAKGHVSLDEWVASGKEESEWVDAKTFIERGKYMDVISKQSKKVKKLEKAIEDLTKMYKTVQEKTAAEVREQLLAEKAAHLENGEYRKAVEVDEKLKEVTAETKQDIKESTNEFTEYFDSEWMPNNTWYKENRRMKAVADDLGVEYISDNPEATPEEVFAYVDKEIRKEFPDKFAVKRPASGKVDSSTRTGKSNTTGKSVRDRRSAASEDEMRAGKRFVELGVFKNLDEYFADLVKHNL